MIKKWLNKYVKDIIEKQFFAAIGGRQHVKR